MSVSKPFEKSGTFSLLIPNDNGVEPAVVVGWSFFCVGDSCFTDTISSLPFEAARLPLGKMVDGEDGREFSMSESPEDAS